jgi:hypothetical protein
MWKKTPAGNYGYVFYGIFRRAASPKDPRSTWFRRINTALVCADWQE